MVSICRKPFMDIICIYIYHIYIYIYHIYYIYNTCYFRNSKNTFTTLRNMMWSGPLDFDGCIWTHSFPYPTLCDFNPISPPRRPFETKVNNSKSLGRISGKWINVLKFLLSICNWWSSTLYLTVIPVCPSHMMLLQQGKPCQKHLHHISSNSQGALITTW